MSNNKQIEQEQIIQAIIQRIKDEDKKHSKSIEDWYRIAANKIYATFDIKIKALKPIELPSDEEMVKAKYEHEMCVFADEYASYVLEQSKPGIKGAMVSMCAWTFFKNRRNEQQ